MPPPPPTKTAARKNRPADGLSINVDMGAGCKAAETVFVGGQRSRDTDGGVHVSCNHRNLCQ